MLKRDPQVLYRGSAALERIARTSHIRIGYCDRAPWSFRGTGEWVAGENNQLFQDADTAHWLARSLDAEARFIECGREQLRTGLYSGALDIAIGNAGKGNSELIDVACVFVAHAPQATQPQRPAGRSFPSVWWLCANDALWQAQVEAFLTYRPVWPQDQWMLRAAS